MIKKIELFIMVIILCSCKNMNDEALDAGTSSFISSPVVTSTSVIPSTTEEIPTEYVNTDARYHTDESDMINIYDYEFASLPFIQDNIMNNSIHTSTGGGIYVLVENEYCEIYAGSHAFGYHDYQPCNKVSNEFYEFGNYKETMFDDIRGFVFFDIEESNNGIPKCAQKIEVEELKSVIAQSTRIVELPIHLEFAFYDETQNLVAVRNDVDHYQMLIYAYDDYFTMRLEDIDTNKVSYTYFENSYMNDYIHEVWNTVENTSCFVDKGEE